MKRLVWLIGLVVMAAAAVTLMRRFCMVDGSEHAGNGVPMEREVPQARAS